MGGLFMGLVLAEGVARIIAPNQAADLLFNASDASPMNLYVIDKETRVTTAPNLDTAIESLDYTVKINTNELGLRGPALSQVSPQTPHWIAVGDSFTMSVQVDQENTFSGQLSTKSERTNMERWCRRIFYLASHPSCPTNQRASSHQTGLVNFLYRERLPRQ